ncbi:MarR family winged helix-turn-helix transcriptional regulator [Cellulosilyticum sp. I15G10I2]|uniref:MarR family winged helix-turn-helix transcriptional regulator n=1 Tax=Cellulosilyticum sp. I15G10I2 TaxID=1892843 RepID=UPI000A3E554A|nr:MarR family transcriptional regulator [Cellulosilyticum sp. I15G10I2]
MQNSIEVVNELLVNLFNDILTIEKAALDSGPFNDLTMTELHVIEAIGFAPRTMTEVASQLGITVGTLTTTINRLVKKEYVLRNHAQDDRRFVVITLTNKGKLAHRLHESFHATMVKSIVDGMSEEDNNILIESLKRLTEFFREQYDITK